MRSIATAVASSVVCLSVCLSVCLLDTRVSLAETTGPMEMPFGADSGGTTEPWIWSAGDPPQEEAILEGCPSLGKALRVCAAVHYSYWHQKRRRTSLPTFDSSVSMVIVLSARHPTGHSLFHGHAAVLTTEAMQLQDHACGTVYLLTCDRWPAMDRSGDIWKHIYLGIFKEITAHCDYHFMRYTSAVTYLFIYLFIYLFTYLLTVSRCVSRSAGGATDDLREDTVSLYSPDVVRRRHVRPAQHDRLQHGLYGREVPREHAGVRHGRRHDRYLHRYHRLGSTHGQTGHRPRTYSLPAEPGCQFRGFSRPLGLVLDAIPREI